MTLHGIAMGDQPFQYIVPITHEASRHVKGRAEAIRTAIESKARELQLDIRAGMFEP